jgi:lysozyme family protein
MGGEPDIVVVAYTKRFDAAWDRLIPIEGGYVNRRADPGGPTKYGISLRFLLGEGLKDVDLDGRGDFDLDMDGDIDIDDIKALSPADAKSLYYRCFWKPLLCEQWPAPIGEAMFDQGVNGGLAAAKKLLQVAINACLSRRAGFAGRPATLAVDGGLGEKTINAFAWVLTHPGDGMPALIAAYRAGAEARYRDLVARNPKLGEFLGGWVKRARNLGAS